MVNIGRTIQQARVDKGYSRSELVRSRKLKSILTSEGLRKIEKNERTPLPPTLKALADVLGIEGDARSQLEVAALQKRVEPLAKRAGRKTVEVKIDGEPLRVLNRAPSTEAETVVRNIVTELEGFVFKYGAMDEDLDHFRKNARAILHRHLTT